MSERMTKTQIDAYIDEVMDLPVTPETAGGDSIETRIMATVAPNDGSVYRLNTSVTGPDVLEDITKLAILVAVGSIKATEAADGVVDAAEYLADLKTKLTDEDIDELNQITQMITYDDDGNVVFTDFDGNTFQLAGVADLDNAFYMLQKRTDEKNGYVTLSPSGYYRKATTGIEARYRDGYFAIDGNPSAACVLRLTDTVTLVQSSSVTSWADGITLEAGEAYRVKAVTVSGQRMNGDTPAFTIPSVYAIGGSSTIGTRVSYDDGEGVEFVAPSGAVNICLYLNANNDYTAVKGYVTLEKIGENAADWTDQRVAMHSAEISDLTNTCDVFVKNGSPKSYINGATMEWFDGLFRLNGTIGNSNLAFRLTVENGWNVTTYSSDYDEGIQLTAGKTYRVSSVNMDGDDLVGVSVYKLGERVTIGRVVTSEDGKYVREFVAPEEPVNLVFFCPAHSVYDNIVGYVTLQDVSDGTGDGIEAYYEAEMAATVETVRNAETEASLVFLSVTDMHRDSASSDFYTFDKTIANMRHFAEQVPCDFLLNLGDLTDGNTTQAVTLELAYDALTKFRQVGVPYLFVNGNHDTNYDSTDNQYLFTPEQNYAAYFTGTPSAAVYNRAVDGTDYYVDYPGLGVRVLVLNANSLRNSGGNVEYRYADNTVSFVEDALDTNNAVLLCVHQSPYSYMENGVLVAPHVAGGQTSGLKGRDISNLLAAFVNGGGTLIEISGHSHRDMAFPSPWVSVMSAANKFYNSSASISGVSGYVDEIVFPERVAGTAAEDCWNVNVYNVISGVLHVIRFGAGNDRIFHVRPIAPTTLTSQLTNVTWSSSDTTVATVSDGVVTAVGAGKCGIVAKDGDGNYECWVVEVPEND